MINKILKTDHDVFQSHELPLIAALVSWDFQILEVNRTDPKKVCFSFQDDTQLQQAIKSFWNGSRTVKPLKYFNALRECKSRIYGGQT